MENRERTVESDGLKQSCEVLDITWRSVKGELLSQSTDHKRQRQEAGLFQTDLEPVRKASSSV
jgi:hypothetical protein